MHLVKKLALLLIGVLTLMTASLLNAETYEGEGNVTQFLSKKNVPIGIAYFNPIPNFDETVKALLSDKNSIADGWVGYSQADVIVFFLASKDELQFLPDLAQKILQQASVGVENNPFVRLDANLTDGRTVMYQFIFLDDLVERRDNTSCSLATLFVANLEGWSFSETRNRTAACNMS